VLPLICRASVEGLVGGAGDDDFVLRGVTTDELVVGDAAGLEAEREAVATAVDVDAVATRPRDQRCVFEAAVVDGSPSPVTFLIIGLAEASLGLSELHRDLAGGTAGSFYDDKVLTAE